jgi:hypothetical protein
MIKKKTPADGDLQTQSKEKNCQGHNSTETTEHQEIKETKKAWEMPDLDDPKYARQMTGRIRNFTFIVYPESAPDDWIEQITALGLPWAMSPLHDKDLNPDETPKKPHYHCIIQYPNTTPIKAFAKIIMPLAHCAIPQKCLSVVGTYRYFSHMDNPEKYQYDRDEIEVFNGFEVSLTNKEIRAAITEIEQMCIDEAIDDMATCEQYLLHYADGTMLDVLRNHTVYFRAWFASFRHNPVGVYVIQSSPTKEDYRKNMQAVQLKAQIAEAINERKDNNDD